MDLASRPFHSLRRHFRTIVGANVEREFKDPWRSTCPQMPGVPSRVHSSDQLGPDVRPYRL